jgi:exopolyphosphatase/guanosine-5'-triphosphate,3'-diphosphate pyrophosphatase
MLAFQKVDFRRNAAILIDAMTSSIDLSENAPTTKEPQSYRIAVIDLGSNTARMVVINAILGYSYRLEDVVREVVRIRQGMTKKGLSKEAVARGLSTLRLFKRFCDSTRVDTILAVATSAVREAANRQEFVEQVQREVGLSLRVLDGEREAYYGTIGVLNEVDLVEGFVLDIGGGSVQVSKVRKGQFHKGQTLTLGALALTERFVRSDPIKNAELEAVQAEIERQLDTMPWLGKAKECEPLVGLGGTIRNLARIEGERQGYPLNTLHGFTLSRGSVEESIGIFRELPLAERQKIRGLRSDRADIILAGALVLAAIMDRLACEELTISVNGLREGIFFERFWQHLPYPVIPDVRRFSVLNLARNYRYQKLHSNHVRFLAGRLFEQLAPLHGYGLAERELLDAAALLHDLGRIISYGSHHRHSQTLIEHNGLPGFSPREIALIALLARYHRKGDPDIVDYGLLLNDDDQVLLMRLSAILRLAESLERGRNVAVDDVIVTWGDDCLRLTLITDEYPAVELWQTERNSLPLVETAFERRVLLDSVAAPSEWPQSD